MKNDFLNLASNTAVGNVRAANEDFLGHAETPNGLLYVVCDGMGGHVGGATAAQMATNSIIEYFNQDPIENVLIGLSDAISYANQNIYNYAQENPELKGMGTTCTVVIAREPQIYIAHVGDSRIYLHTDGKLHRITKDHSFVQGLVDQGIIQDEEAENHPRKNEILKALGIRAEVEPTVFNAAIQAKKGDKFLLCSDGLNGEVNDPTIESLINKNTDINKAGDELIEAALNAGGKDNITLQIIEVLNSPHEKSAFPNYNPKSILVSTDQEISSNPEHTSTMVEVEDNGGSFLKKNKNSIISVLGGLAVLIGVYFIWPAGDGDKNPGEPVTSGGGKVDDNNGPKENTETDNSNYYSVTVKESEGWDDVRMRIKKLICDEDFDDSKFKLTAIPFTKYSQLIKWHPNGRKDEIKEYDPKKDEEKLDPSDVVLIDKEEFRELYERENPALTQEDKIKRKTKDLKERKQKTLTKAKNIQLDINKITDNTKEKFNSDLEAQKNKLTLISIEENYKHKIKNIESELDKIQENVSKKIEDVKKEEPKNDGEKKDDVKKEEPKKDGEKKDDVKKDDVKKEEPKKDGEKKDDVKKDDVKKEEPKKDGEKNDDVKKEEPKKDGES